MRTTATTALRRMLNPKTRAQRQWLVLTIVLVLVDAFSVAGGLTIAYFVRIDGILPYYSVANNEAYKSLMFAAVPIFLACFALLGLYQQDNLLGGVIEYKQFFKAVTLGVGMVVVYTVFMRMQDFEVSRLWLVISWALTSIIGCALRFFVRRVVYRLRETGMFATHVLIVGANDQGLAIAAQWRNTPSSGMNIVGFLDDFKTIGTQVAPGLKVIGRPSAIDAVAAKYAVDEVVVVSSAVAWESFGELVTDVAADKPYTLRLSPGFYELLTTGVAVTNKTFVPLLTINENRIVGVDAFLKSAVDYGLGGLSMVMSLPATLLIALALKVRRPGVPVLTRNQAIGRNGQSFNLIRFNTAPVVGQNSRSFERWLRVTGLNKLPELMNVLQGDLSLVGPRPRAAHNSVTDMHTMHNLQAVKPGIVGPWLRRDHMHSPSVEHDELMYVRNWTIWADLPVLFQATMTLLSKLGYRGSAKVQRQRTQRAARIQVQKPETMSARLERNFQEDLLI